MHVQRSPEVGVLRAHTEERAALLSVNALCCGSVSSGFLGFFFLLSRGIALRVMWRRLREVVISVLWKMPINCKSGIDTLNKGLYFNEDLVLSSETKPGIL